MSLTVKKLLLLSNLYSKHLNRLNNRSNNHSNLCNNKLQLPKAPCLKALLLLNNSLSNLHNHRYSNQHALSLLMVKRPLLLSSRYSKHLNRLNSLCNSKWPPPKALCLKALLLLSNSLSNLHNHRYSNQHALSLLMVKRPLLLSSRYSKLNSLSSQCNSKWPLPKALYLKALLPLSNRLNSLLSHRYSNQHVLS